MNEEIDGLIRQLEVLRVQEGAILQRIKDAREKQKRSAKQETEQGIAGWRVGDKARIKNRISHVTGRAATIKDRNCTVVGVEVENDRVKVHIRTENGYRTWRLDKNLLRL